MTKQFFSVANAEKLSAQAIAEMWMPPQLVDYLAWAVDNIVFTERESRFPGPYNRRRFPFFDEILRTLSPEDPCRIVTFKKSAQLGGTILANIFCLGTLDMDPCDVLYVHPTETNATRWSKTKLSPMLKNTTCLTKVFPQKSRDGLDSVLYKERSDGRGAITIGGANSAASLSMITAKRQVQDDLSKWVPNSAGDPESQADSRSRGMEFAKILKISTPLIEPGCKITKNFKSGSMERLHVPCLECGTMQVLEHENLEASFDENDLQAAHFTCVNADCDNEFHQYDIAEMVLGGEWIAEKPERKRVHRSFDLWSAYSPLQSFETIAREYFASRGDPEAEKTYLNDTVGQAYETKGEAPAWETLRDRAANSDYHFNTIPAGFPLVTAGIDCQGTYVEAQIVAWGPRNQSSIIGYRRFDGHISTDRCRVALDDFLKERFENAYGQKLTIDRVGIDGNAYTEDVWDWVKKHPRHKVIMVRGNPNEASPRIKAVKAQHSNKGKRKRYTNRFYHFNASIMKMALYRNLAVLDPLARSYVGLPRGLDDEFYRMLTAERRVAKTSNGFTKYVWDKDPNQANEALDTYLQAETAATHLGVRDMPEATWDKYFKERETEPDPVQTDIEDLFAKPIAISTGIPIVKRTKPEKPKWKDR